MGGDSAQDAVDAVAVHRIASCSMKRRIFSQMKGMITRTSTTATAVPCPTLKNLYISRYIRTAITSVWKLPPVITYTMSNTFSVLITMVVITTTIVGMIMGTMMRQKIDHSVAPSTRAASRISSGTDLMAADKMVMQKPVQIQMPTMISAAMLMPGVWIHAIGFMPSPTRIAF